MMSVAIKSNKERRLLQNSFPFKSSLLVLSNCYVKWNMGENQPTNWLIWLFLHDDGTVISFNRNRRVAVSKGEGGGDAIRVFSERGAQIYESRAPLLPFSILWRIPQCAKIIIISGERGGWGGGDVFHRELFSLPSLCKAAIFRLTALVVERHAFADTVTMATDHHFASLHFLLRWQAMSSTSWKRHFARLHTCNKFVS